MSETQVPTVLADKRSRTGTAIAKRMRAQGIIPGVVFGNGKGSVALSFPEKSLRKLHLDNKLLGHIIQVSTDGKTEQVLVRFVQTHPLRDDVIHLDLERISRSKKITTDLKIEYVGEKEAPASRDGGQIIHFMSSVSIECLPDDLPDHIIVDVSALNLDQALHCSDLALPKGVDFSQAIDEAHNPPVCVFHLSKISEEPEEDNSELIDEEIQDTLENIDDNENSSDTDNDKS